MKSSWQVGWPPWPLQGRQSHQMHQVRKIYLWPLLSRKEVIYMYCPNSKATQTTAALSHAKHKSNQAAEHP